MVAAAAVAAVEAMGEVGATVAVAEVVGVGVEMVEAPVAVKAVVTASRCTIRRERTVTHRQATAMGNCLSLYDRSADRRRTRQVFVHLKNNG